MQVPGLSDKVLPAVRAEGSVLSSHRCRQLLCDEALLRTETHKHACDFRAPSGAAMLVPGLFTDAHTALGKHCERAHQVHLPSPPL